MQESDRRIKARRLECRAENKLLLVDFTGSDWCGWCMKLASEVFSKDAFKNEAPKKFVLVELDYPREKKQSDELKKQNKELQAKYQIHGYPTILVLDPEGVVVAKTGYQAGGAEKYVKHLAKFVEVHDDVVKRTKELAGTSGLNPRQAARQADISATKARIAFCSPSPSI